jgi:hypothetical protein
MGALRACWWMALVVVASMGCAQAKMGDCCDTVNVSTVRATPWQSSTTWGLASVRFQANASNTAPCPAMFQCIPCAAHDIPKQRTSRQLSPWRWVGATQWASYSGQINSRLSLYTPDAGQINSGAGVDTVIECGACGRRDDALQGHDAGGVCTPCLLGDYCPAGTVNPLATTGLVACPDGKVRSLGDAERSLGDAESSLDDARSSLGDVKSSLGDAESSLCDAESSLGDAESSLGDAESSLCDAESSLGDAETSLGNA